MAIAILAASFLHPRGTVIAPMTVTLNMIGKTATFGSAVTAAWRKIEFIRRMYVKEQHMNVYETGNGSREIPKSPAFLDIETIRRRVAKIKYNWSPEIAEARAVEGHRRRRELEDLLLDRLCDTTESEEAFDLKALGFSLVG